jgi:hypothetical protein
MIHAVLLVGAVAAGCGGDGVSTSDVETQVMDGLQDDVADRGGVSIDDVGCVRRGDSNEYRCIANAHLEARRTGCSVRFSLTATAGDDGEVLYEGRDDLIPTSPDCEVGGSR